LRGLNLTLPTASEEAAGALSGYVAGQKLSFSQVLEAAQQVLREGKAAPDWLWNLCLNTDLLALSLVQSGEDAKTLAGKVTSVLDVVANRDSGAGSFDSTVGRLLDCFRLARRAEDMVPDGLAAAMLEKLCLKYGSSDVVVDGIVEEALSSLRPLGDELKSVTDKSAPSILRCLCRRAGKRLTQTLGQSAPSYWPKIFSDLLLSSFCRREKLAAPLTSYLATSSLAEDDLFAILERSLQLWGDPVIAKAYVAGEVMHYSRVTLCLFASLPVATRDQRRGRVVELVMRGLPNHFDTADGRTVELAHYLSQIVTETLKDKEDGPAVELAAPKQELCRELLDSLRECEAAKDFWLQVIFKFIH